MQLDARAYLELAEPFGLLGAATIPIGMALHEFGKRQI
jgi:hypothetical protein